MRTRNDDGLDGFKKYLLANAAFFFAVFYATLPKRQPSLYDYDYQTYQNGDFPYGNTAFLVATNATIIMNVVCGLVYLAFSGKRETSSPVSQAIQSHGLFQDNPLVRCAPVNYRSTVRVEEVIESEEMPESNRLPKP